MGHEHGRHRQCAYNWSGTNRASYEVIQEELMLYWIIVIIVVLIILGFVFGRGRFS
jgi:hypothetical protein